MRPKNTGTDEQKQGVKVRTAKNTTDLLQVVNFTSLLQQTCQLHQVATSL